MLDFLDLHAVLQFNHSHGDGKLLYRSYSARYLIYEQLSNKV